MAQISSLTPSPWSPRSVGISSTWKRIIMSVGALLILTALICFRGADLNGDDVYAMTHFCSANGTCHEKPNEPSPRTVYSANSRAQYERWWHAHAKLNASAAAYAERRRRQQPNSRPLILLGDSITEAWMGTSMGRTARRARGVPDVLKQLIVESKNQWDPLVLAIGGDQTQHLLWRLQHGQLVASDNPEAVYVVLIGTNNLGSGELPEPTAQGVLAVAECLLTHTTGRVVVLEILPRGDGFRMAPICPPRCTEQGEPLVSFAPAVNSLNHAVVSGLEALQRQQQGQGTQPPPRQRLDWISCGKPFVLANEEDTLEKKSSEVDRKLMPDLLHPNAIGHRVLGDCIFDYLTKGFKQGH